jgi:hypothetical protein
MYALVLYISTVLFWRLFRLYTHVLIPVVAQSKAWVCGCSLAGIAGLNSAGDMDVCLMLSGRGLCVGLITRPEESY